MKTIEFKFNGKKWEVRSVLKTTQDTVKVRRIKTRNVLQVRANFTRTPKEGKTCIRPHKLIKW